MTILEDQDRVGNLRSRYVISAEKNVKRFWSSNILIAEFWSKKDLFSKGGYCVIDTTEECIIEAELAKESSENQTLKDC